MSGLDLSTRRDREALAIRMIRMGFRGSIIAHEADLSGVTVRRLRREIFGEGTTASSGRLPESSGIVRVRRRLIEAGMFVLIYRSLTDTPPNSRPAIATIMHAFEMYSELHCAVHLGHSLEGQLLRATDAWVLARDLHTGWIGIARCRSCRAPYLTVPDQHLSHGCPFCSLGGAPPPTRCS